MPADICPEKPSKCTYKVGMPLIDSPHTNVESKTPPKILPTILDGIGNSPMVRINKIGQSDGLQCDMLAKCEFLNPGGSVKDRVALRMIEDAEISGILKPESTIVEPTSGNFGIAICMAAAVKGYPCIITMPEHMSKEKADVMTALGARLILTPAKATSRSPQCHYGVAKQLCDDNPDYVCLNQYVSPSNPLSHYDGTGSEIIDACDGKVDMVVMGTGTGGTLTGIARKLREKCPDCKIIGVDPEGSIMAEPSSINTPATRPKEVEGIGHDFLPTVFERKLVDKWYKCNDKETFMMARRLIREEGLLCGGSSGAAMYCAIQAAKDFGMTKGDNVVVVLPDRIRNYLTKFVSDDWMKEKGFIESEPKSQGLIHQSNGLQNGETNGF